MKENMRKEHLLVKLAGGSAAQTLGLMNAIYLGKEHLRPFKIRHFPHSTGTHWPLAISFLLEETEIESESAPIKGLDPDGEYAVGKIIRNHPLETKKFSWEYCLKLIRKFRLEYLLRLIKRELAIEARPARLINAPTWITTISGGYVPLLDSYVMNEMHRRFSNSGRKSPFAKSHDLNPYIAIHYRIGDKRTKFSVDSDFGGDGIFDPACFKSLLESQTLDENLEVVVLSDEPHVAQGLLQDEGIDAKLPDELNDIWSDLYVMSQARIFLGSWSQVSQLAAVCVASNGGQAYLPNTTLDQIRVHWKIPKVNFFQPKFLAETHPIYSPDFELSPDSHLGYRKKKI